MPLILAIEADRKQTAKIAVLAKGPLKAELVAGETTQEAVAALAGRVPDLILTSLLLSPKDETALGAWLRDLDAAGRHVQTLVIPVLGAMSHGGRGEGAGLLKRLRRPSKDDASEGCDPSVFSAQISEYLKRGADEREAREYEERLALQDHWDAEAFLDPTAEASDRPETHVTPQSIVKPKAAPPRPLSIIKPPAEPAPPSILKRAPTAKPQTAQKLHAVPKPGPGL